MQLSRLAIKQEREAYVSFQGQKHDREDIEESNESTLTQEAQKATKKAEQSRKKSKKKPNQAEPKWACGRSYQIPKCYY